MFAVINVIEIEFLGLLQRINDLVDALTRYLDHVDAVVHHRDYLAGVDAVQVVPLLSLVGWQVRGRFNTTRNSFLFFCILPILERIQIAHAAR